MVVRTIAVIAALAALFTCVLVGALQAQREPYELLLTRGGFAGLAGEGEAAGSKVYLAPGTRLRTVGAGKPDGDLLALTESGLTVAPDPHDLLDPAERQALRAAVGRNVAFVLSPMTVPVAFPDGEREVDLVPGNAYRAFMGAERSAVLAVDLCAAGGPALDACDDDQGLPVLRGVRVPIENVVLLDLDRLEAGHEVVSAPLTRLTVKEAAADL